MNPACVDVHLLPPLIRDVLVIGILVYNTYLTYRNGSRK